MPRELIVRPLGLVTRPNQYGQYPIGALSAASNLVMRAPGILSAAPAPEVTLSWGASNEVVHALVPINGAMISVSRTSGGVWTVRRNTTGYLNPANLSTVATFSSDGGISAFESRGRIFINSPETGLLVIDDPAGAPNRLRCAGLPQGIIFNVTLNSDAGPALPSKAVAGYTYIIRRKFADGYELASEPAPVYQMFNASGVTSNTQFQCICNYAMGLDIGDIVELYKTNVILNANELAGTFTSNTDPGTTLQLVSSFVLTNAELTTGYVVMPDNSQQGPLGVTDGKALYTNPGQEGTLGANKRPPICKRATTFKNYAFYANITELPLLTFNVPAAISWTLNPGFGTDIWRDKGIGRREITGTTAIGSNVITGVSASHIRGIKIGQFLSGAAFVANTRVTAVGATTITVSNNASAAGAATFVSYDVIELNGSESIIAISPQYWLYQFAQNFNEFCVNTTETALQGQDPATGVPKITFLISFAQANRKSATNTMTVRATNGANYDPPLPEWTSSVRSIPPIPRPNILAWSKDSQPEHVPVANYTQVGNGSIIAIEATRDALWIFCTDGLFRLSGDGGQWRVDTIDTTCILAAPRAACVLREVIYAYTNAGFVRVTDAGVEPLSQRIVGDLLPGAEYTETASVIVERNEIEDEVVIRLSTSEVYVYSVRENAYTTLNEANVTAMAYARYPVAGAPALAFGASAPGSAPRYDLWNSTLTWLAASARFQPMFAGDPFTAKQWIDGTFVFSAASGLPNITPAWNGNLGSQSQVSGSPKWVNEGRVLFGVPRAAAIGNTLCPGFNVGSRGSRTDFLALSMRYRQFGEQHLKR